MRVGELLYSDVRKEYSGQCKSISSLQGIVLNVTNSIQQSTSLKRVLNPNYTFEIKNCVPH
jgi:hypothetical protein